MALPTAYADVTYANAFIGQDNTWLLQSISQKETALSYGRVYLDKHYACSTFEVDDAPDDVKNANSYLALQYVTGLLYDSSDSQVQGVPLERELVKAGTVEVETEYAVSASTAVYTDKFPLATDLLSQTCTLVSRSVGISTLYLGRN